MLICREYMLMEHGAEYVLWGLKIKAELVRGPGIGD